MGEVYRARDTRLKRDIALKVLPQSFAGDAERMTRLQREAEVLASLNHSNIAAIYGLEDRALVMELVEGRTLAESSVPGTGLPIYQALRLATQIAHALEYAHERGVVHRDLKPANIKVTPDGVAKLLDRGLAKATQDPIPPTSFTQSPTIAVGLTQAGVLGTAAYMSPEQARGKGWTSYPPKERCPRNRIKPKVIPHDLADGLHPCGFRVLGSASTSQTLLQQRGQAPRCHRLPRSPCHRR